MSDEPWLPQQVGELLTSSPITGEESSETLPITSALAGSEQHSAEANVKPLWAAFEFPFFSLPWLGWAALLTYFLADSMHFVGAVLLAGVIATFCVFVFGLLFGGHTLVEMGCGATIALVLAVILVPVFAQAREKARQTTCLTNLKRAGQAIALYSADYDDYLPLADRWADVTAPYLPAPAKQAPVVKGLPNCAPNYTEANYAFDTRIAGKSLPKAWQQAQMIMVYDSASRDRNAYDAGISVPIPGRHLGRNNGLFMDGHARNVKAPQEKPRLRAER
jgi:prepilin-type processing-associated H-X9-DG protein